MSRIRWSIADTFQCEQHLCASELPRFDALDDKFQMSVIFRLAYGRRVRTLQDEIVVENTKAGGSESRSA